MNKKIYISGKITGDPDYMEHFASAEKAVTSKDFEAINPARTNSTLPGTLTYLEYMKVALTLLEMCGSIYMLDNWEGSPGATAEYYYAKALGINIFYENELNAKECQS